MCPKAKRGRARGQSRKESQRAKARRSQSPQDLLKIRMPDPTDLEQSKPKPEARSRMPDGYLLRSSLFSSLADGLCSSVDKLPSMDMMPRT